MKILRCLVYKIFLFTCFFLFVPLALGAEKEKESSPKAHSAPGKTSKKAKEVDSLELPLWERPKLTGSWGGVRTLLKKKGVEFEIVYTAEVMANVVGGIHRKVEPLDNWDLIVSVDGEKLLGWQGASFLLYGLSNLGGDPSENIGDFQVTSNIEAPDTVKILGAWYEQNLFDDRLSLRVGMYDINSEFDFIKSAQVFLNSSFGIGAELAATGQNGPSTFPVTAPIVRLRLRPSRALNLQIALADGVPGDPNNPHGNTIELDGDGGAFLIGEMNYIVGKDKGEVPYGKYGVGVWYYTEKFPEIKTTTGMGSPRFRRGNSGFYFLAEQTLYREEEGRGGLALFGRIGVADQQFNQVYLYTGGGAVYTGLFPSRDQDKLGVGLAIAHNGGDFQDAQPVGQPVEDREYALEITYLAEITPWFHLQPDIQIIFNPSMIPERDDALVLALRGYINF